MKKEPAKSPQTDENKSPMANNNKMMMSWLSKGNKVTNKPEEKQSTAKANQSPIKTSNKNITSKPISSKTASSRFKNLISDEEDSEALVVTEKSEKSASTSKTENKTSSKKAKEKTTPPPKKETVKKATKSSKKDELEESPGLEEKKTASAKKPANKFYAAYMRREGPKNPGSKPVPIGKPNCFSGLKFLTTGVLDSLDRDECKRIIEKYGGSVISGVTKKLDYLIVGEDAGQSKLEKANELKIIQINEDEFLQLICKKSGITNPKYESTTELDESLNELKSDKSLNESMDTSDSGIKSKKNKSSDNFDNSQAKKIKSESEEKSSPKKSGEFDLSFLYYL